MSSRRKTHELKEETTELLRDLLIVQLGMANVSQQDIRKIAKCSISRVNRIVRLLKPQLKRTQKRN